MEEIDYFNTTLVFIYQMAHNAAFEINAHFNTTLVFINPTFLSHSSISIISLNLDIFNVFPLFPQPAVSF